MINGKTTDEDDDPDQWTKATTPDRLRRLAADYLALFRESVELQKGGQ